MSTTIAPPSTLVLGPEDNGILMTPEEFDAIEEYDEEYRYELINGVLIVSPVPMPQERSLNDLLAYFLLKYQREDPQGSALDDTLPEHIVETGRNRRRADRVIWAGLGRMPNYKTDTPTIIIEFISKRRRDRRRDLEEKRDEYLGLDIAEYWAFDRFQRQMFVFVKTPTGVEERVLTEHDVYRTPRLPGFEFSVASFLALAAKWGL
jgi:Uma2 family endonuclease